MFFLGVFGGGNKAEEIPGGPQMVCPVCGRSGQFHLTKSFSYFHVFFIPLFKWGGRYFATCPHCASAFEVEPEAGKTMEKDGIAFSAGSMRLLRNNADGLCPNCGARNPPGSLYCNMCGGPMR